MVAALTTDQPSPQTQIEPLVRLESVTVSFDGFKALDINAFSVGESELRVVIGPNGAGKTTLCDVISGKTRVTSGKVFFGGVETTKMRDAAIARMGVGRKFDSLTVFENMELALPNERSVFRNLFGSVTPEQNEAILTVLDRVRLIGDMYTPAKYLSHGQRQWLEISMLIVAHPKLLLIDEPAAGLTDKETELTAELLLELKGRHTIICIEHDMDFVRRLNSRVTVLDNGKVLAEGTLDEVQANEQVVEAYLGR